MHKTKMYACIVFFSNGEAKRWKYVKDLNSFSQFLSREHGMWKYFNVYEKGSKQFIKRFYTGNLIPRILPVLVLLLMSATGVIIGKAVTLEKTFNVIAVGGATFNNGFN